jgi:aspartate carbamoyltransferase catalytic subunit
LRGKTIANLFIEPSTRTRISFELAAKRLPPTSLTSRQRSSLVKAKPSRTPRSTYRHSTPTAIVIRHSSAALPHFMAKFLKASVINAGDGAHEHPTQASLDAFTIREKKGRIAGLNVTILGDILYSRSRAQTSGLPKLGAHVTLVWAIHACATRVRTIRLSGHARHGGGDPRRRRNQPVAHQHERQQDNVPEHRRIHCDVRPQQNRFSRTKPDVLIMHPGPINRGVEIDSDVADCGRSVILEQVTNGLAVRMAVLFLCSGGKHELTAD